MIALLFLIFLAGLVSTFFTKGKRWWGSSGYRVRIVRRNFALTSVMALLLIVVTHSPKPAPATKATNERVITIPSPTTEQARQEASKTGESQIREVTLPSGRKIKVIGVGQLNFSHDSPALMLKYQTDLKISDLPALRKEVEEIWPVFRSDVEKANLTNAIISANQAPQGSIIQESNGYNFVFKKVDGTWRLLGNAEKPSGQPAS